MTDAPPIASHAHEAHINAKCGERKDPLADRPEGKYRTSHAVGSNLRSKVCWRPTPLIQLYLVNVSITNRRRPFLCHPFKFTADVLNQINISSNQARKGPILSWFTDIRYAEHTSGIVLLLSDIPYPGVLRCPNENFSQGYGSLTMRNHVIDIRTQLGL